MGLSLLWSLDMTKSLSGIQKQLSMFFIPVAFFFVPNLTKVLVHKIIRIYSFSMVLFGLFFLLNACLRFIKTHHFAIFFNDELVPQNLGAIYASVFASLAFFYFMQLQTKSNLDRFCIFILALLIFLLSSKSIITIDFIIFIFYYVFFAEIPSGTKTLTIFSVSTFLFLSVYFVEEVKERFLTEYETAFFDNTIREKRTNERQISCNVSINDAWNKREFQQNCFFPGTALRVYQFRVFLEIVADNPIIILKGLGLEASQNNIIRKAREHNLNPAYAEHNFHNQYVQTFADSGILGFLILVCMLIINLKNAFEYKDFLHIAFAITMLMLFLSESFFCRQRGIVFFITLFCLFNSIPRKEAGEAK